MKDIDVQYIYDHFGFYKIVVKTPEKEILVEYNPFKPTFYTTITRNTQRGNVKKTNYIRYIIDHPLVCHKLAKMMIKIFKAKYREMREKEKNKKNEDKKQNSIMHYLLK